MISCKLHVQSACCCFPWLYYEGHTAAAFPRTAILQQCGTPSLHSTSKGISFTHYSRVYISLEISNQLLRKFIFGGQSWCGVVTIVQ